MTPRSGGGLLVLAGLAALALAAACNEWTAARWFAHGAALEPGFRSALRMFDAVTLAAGLALIGWRRAIWRRLSAGVRQGDGTLRAILWAGIALRLVVFVFLQPTNNDPHINFVEFIVEHGRLPWATEQILGFHPPLYFVLAAGFLWLGGTAKFVQVFSLLLSIANVILLYRLVRSTPLLRTWSARCHAMALCALLPQFVLFNAFVCNDALSFPLGTLLILQAFCYLERPGRANLMGLAAVEGLGLLTKGTFLVGLPALGGLILLVELRRRRTLLQIAGTGLLFGVLAGGIGCYKFVENTIGYGAPIVSNDQLHQEWMEWQQGTWQGWRSVADVNVGKLIAKPFLGEHTKHSLPLLYYGTFWYSHIKESNFNATRQSPLSIVPRLLYLLGILPTLLMLATLLRWLWINRWPPSCLRIDDRAFAIRTGQMLLVALLLLQLATVTTWGLKHDAWSFFQSRLLFPSFFAITALLGGGIDHLAERRPRWLPATHAWLLALYATFTLYYLTEFAA